MNKYIVKLKTKTEMTKKETTLVAFSTQKGGAGKTTLTVLMASYLYYVRGLDVVVVDCDYPQYSIQDMRERDMKRIDRNPALRQVAFEQFSRLKKKTYPIVNSAPENAVEVAKGYIESATPPDVIFFDLTGTVNNPAIINTIGLMDYVFCPITADRIVATSSLSFASTINEKFISTGQSNIKGLHMMWNMVDGREKTDLYGQYDKIFGELGLSVMETKVPDSKRFRKEGEAVGKNLFRSTILPPDKALLRGSNIDKLADEFLKLINYKG